MTGRRRPPRRSGTTLKVIWTDRALADLDAIGDYIAKDSPAAAARWVGDLMAAAERVAGMPLAGRRVPELGRDDVREVFRRTYRIVYRVHQNRMEVLTVFEEHRLFPAVGIDDE